MWKIPFVTPLLKLKASSHRKAIKEVMISTVLSTLPIWLGGLLGGMLAKAKSPTESFWQTMFDGMSEFISQGELYMLAVATLAPIFYIGNAIEKGDASVAPSMPGIDRGGWPFPQLDIHRFFVALFITVAAVVFFYMRKESVTDTPYVKAVSLFFYFASLVMIYAASAYNEDRVSYQGFVESADDEEAFRSDYSSHRGSK